MDPQTQQTPNEQTNMNLISAIIIQIIIITRLAGAPEGRGYG